MKNNFSHSESFLPLSQTAVRLGVPAAWSRTEADAGRVLYLCAGRRVSSECEKEVRRG